MTIDWNVGGAQGRTALKSARLRLLAGFNRVLDAVEHQIEPHPPPCSRRRRKAVSVARERPLLIMAAPALGL